MHPRILTLPLLSLLLTLLLIVGCSDPLPQAPPTASPAASPERISIRDAVNFSVEYEQDAKLVHVRETTPGASGAVYVLVQRGAPEPEAGWASLADALVAEHDLAAPTVIEVPLRSIFTSSTTHLPALEIIGELDRLTGVSQADFVSSEAVRAMLDADELAVFAPTYVVDAEIVLAHRPDVVMTSGFWDDAYEVVAGAGTAIVHNGDWVESSPLGRAEWVKFISLFFNRETEAEAWYEQVRANYLAARELAGSVETRPTVHTGLVWGDVWLASGGGSYVAQLLADAGADYVWADNSSTGSLEHDLETQLSKAGAAEFWLHAASWWTSSADAIAEDARYAEFAALQQGKIWNPVRRTNERGANDYFEQGAVRPDLVLADLVAIFHPDLTPDHEFVFYARLATE